MTDVKAMFDNTEVAIVASDADFKLIYINEKCRKLFRTMKRETSVGKDMVECHKPETMQKLNALYQQYRERKKALDHSIVDISGTKYTIVNVPFYQDDKFAGVVVYFFEADLIS